MKTLSERLRHALDGPPRITQKALADACGIKPPSVNDWLSGETKMLDAVNLLAACKLLKVNPKWLATGVGAVRDQASTWPFESVSEENYRRLTPEQQGVVQGRADALIEQMLNTHEKSTSYKGNHSNPEMNVPQTSRSISSERSEQLKKLGIFDVTPKGQDERSKPQKAREPRTS